jgi:hypothetical protein
MKKLRIYLDTSVISFLFADDALKRRDIWQNLVRQGLRRKSDGY